MSDEDLVNIEVDGKSLQARRGQMLIEVTDAAEIYIPRFCYHDKLSVAANCRMCLVEVEKAPKPLPACATPVNEGMKVFTRSERAVSAQKATMEFLLINHPLDCPICDQGGECELQDLAMGFGRDVSRYTERKRVVKDKDLGPLVSTDMTRCIHCTRCVRFGQEIAGIQELGTTDRGEHMKIGTYIEKSVDHELSGNIIDICPVGALNNKPYRYSARAWEMVQRPMISPHDCVGSNLYAHVLRGTVKRIVPKKNEEINETWLADRDRFSYEGIYSEDRLLAPRLKRDGQWETVSWEGALSYTASRLRAIHADDPADIALLSTPNATLEECHLLARLAAGLGTVHIDHRLRRQDFRDQEADPVFPWLGSSIAGLEDKSSILVVGSDIRREAPILAHRLRKAAMKGASISFVNGRRYPYFFPLLSYLEGGLVGELAGIAVAAAEASDIRLPGRVQRLTKRVKPTRAHRAVAESLVAVESSHLLLGNIALRHAAFADLRSLAAAVTEITDATLGYITEGSNAAGAAIAGVLPHRGAAGQPRRETGKDVQRLLTEPARATLLFHVDPAHDIVSGAQATQALHSGEFVVSLTPYVTDSLESVADVMLPIGTAFETSGTFVNVEGRRQSFSGVANPVGESRPGWKVLRVIGNMMDLPGFDYLSSEDVRAECLAGLDTVAPDNRYDGDHVCEETGPADAPQDLVEVPIYQIDSLVRHAQALQLTADGREGARKMEQAG